MQPTRRTLVRSAAWTVPAVSLAVAAPAYAVSNFSCPVVTSTWSWDGVSLDDGGRNAGDLTWTLSSGKLLTGSTITITAQVTQPNYEVFNMELRKLNAMSSSLTGSWSNADFRNGKPAVLLLTVQQDIVAGSTLFVNFSGANPAPWANDPPSGYTATWTIDPAEPTGASTCETNPTGCVRWFNDSGAGGSGINGDNGTGYQGDFTTC